MIKNLVSILSSVYWINDPTTPELQEPQIIPPDPNLKINVQGRLLKNPLMPARLQAINCQITTSRALNYFESIYHRFSPPLKQWAGNSVLSLSPRAGKRMNAFYNRKGIFLFFANDPKTKKLIFTCDSADIVAHELGHAILDAIRPDFWNLQSVETWAFHEAFADITSFVTITQSDIAIQYALQETGGNLRISNVMSRIAEEVGMSARGDSCLRDATQRFDYISPSLIPKKADYRELSHEMHSFGRIFLSAFYELIMKVYEKECGLLSQIDAFKKARDEIYTLVLKAVKTAPATPQFMDSMAKAMIAADASAGGIHQKILYEVFEDRKIFKATIKMLSNLTLEDVKLDISEDDIVLRKANTFTLTKRKFKKIILGDYFVSTQSENPLMYAEIEIPQQEYFHFDETGCLVEEIRYDEQEALNHALLCLDFIKHDGFGKDSTWQLSNNKLIRNYID